MSPSGPAITPSTHLNTYISDKINSQDLGQGESLLPCRTYQGESLLPGLTYQGDSLLQGPDIPVLQSHSQGLKTCYVTGKFEDPEK